MIDPPVPDVRRDSVSGWWYVILLLVPALMFQGFLLPYRSHVGKPEMEALVVADALIAFRAMYAVILEDDRSRWWVVYGGLYFVLPFVATFVYDAL